MNFRELFIRPVIGIFVVMTIFASTDGLHAQVVSGSINGHDYVDLGLSVKWATCNVGADSPEEYGDYYAWGETSTKSSYTEKNSKAYGKNIDDIKGNSYYDVARANWGGKWRMPTKKEIQELKEKCTWTWTAIGSHSGYKVTGPSGKSIFLPAAGLRDKSLKYANERGYYLSSTPCKNHDNNYESAYFLDISIFTLKRAT